MANSIQGVFTGRALSQTRGSIGGSRYVFVKLKGKDELIFPSIGGKIMNPPKGNGFKAFAGDLVWYKTDDNGVKPEIYLLKTYLIESVDETAKVISIVKDDFKHVPFVGDKLGVAPAAIGGAMTAGAVTAVTKGKVGDVPVWTLTLDTALTGAKKGDILVEADADNKMLVKKINAVLPNDEDMYEAGTTTTGDFEGKKYTYTPALGGLMYTNRMSPMPACVKALNKSEVNGWFLIGNI